MSILVDIAVTPFSVKRRSNPEAAFAEMMDRFLVATSENDEMAKAFASFQEHFRGVALKKSDAIRLADLEGRGARQLGIKVGRFPWPMGVGIAYMYDAAIETLRSTDLPIEPELIGARAIRMLERSLDTALPLVGSMSVSALELALNDDLFADRLRGRASKLASIFLDDPPAPCDYCIITTEDKDGNVTGQYCGTKQQCEVLGGIILIFLILLLLEKLWDWLK
jgi:hypothetical protein